MIALAHPLTMITAFFAAPVTSLTPLIGAGYVAAFVQVYFQPPLVNDFQNVSDNAKQVLMWWKNKLLKVLLVFILASLGSVLGTYVGLFEIVKNVFK